MCLAFLSVSWTASSQITGISKEQKQEIVFTLLDYPLVLKELSAKEKLYREVLNMNNLLNQKIDLYVEKDEAWQEKDEINQKEIKTLNDIIDQQRKNDKNNNLLWFGGGTGFGVILALLIKLLI